MSLICLFACFRPVESVQRTVSDCMVSLVQLIKAHHLEYVKAALEQLMVRCTEGDAYGTRRGAAFGISAVVKGLGE